MALGFIMDNYLRIFLDSFGFRIYRNSMNTILGLAAAVLAVAFSVAMIIISTRIINIISKKNISSLREIKAELKRGRK